MRSKLEELQNVCAEVVDQNEGNEEKEGGQLMENCESKNPSLDDPNDSAAEDNHSSVSTNEVRFEFKINIIYTIKFTAIK
jgi:hypothetical protein